jgi:hypothetical protein
MNAQWSLDALIARYELHPDFKELYVEGEGDIGFYQMFLDECGRSDVLVYPISAVSIPPDPTDELLQILRLDGRSRRSDVISLALVLEKRIPEAARRVTCIADADTQRIQPEGFETRFLQFTDYTSIESYAFRADIVTKIFRIGSPYLQIKGEEVLAEMTSILETLFGIRVASYRLGWGLKWISPEGDLEYKNEILAFDHASYLNKYLNTKGKLNAKSDFQVAVDTVRSMFLSDHRMQIRGHDYVELLTWYMRKRAYKVFHKYSSEIVRHLLLSHLRKEDLTSEALFATLLTKYAISQLPDQGHLTT